MEVPVTGNMVYATLASQDSRRWRSLPCRSLPAAVGLWRSRARPVAVLGQVSHKWVMYYWPAHPAVGTRHPPASSRLPQHPWTDRPGWTPAGHHGRLDHDIAGTWFLCWLVCDSGTLGGSPCSRYSWAVAGTPSRCPPLPGLHLELTAPGGTVAARPDGGRPGFGNKVQALESARPEGGGGKLPPALQYSRRYQRVQNLGDTRTSLKIDDR